MNPNSKTEMYSKRIVLHFIQPHNVVAIQKRLDVSQSCQVGSSEASKVEKMHLLHPLTLEGPFCAVRALSMMSCLPTHFSALSGSQALCSLGFPFLYSRNCAAAVSFISLHTVASLPLMP